MCGFLCFYFYFITMSIFTWLIPLPLHSRILLLKFVTEFKFLDKDISVTCIEIIFILTSRIIHLSIKIMWAIMDPNSAMTMTGQINCPQLQHTCKLPRVHRFWVCWFFLFVYSICLKCFHLYPFCKVIVMLVF